MPSLKLLDIRWQTGWIGPVIIAVVAVCLIIFAFARNNRRNGSKKENNNPKNKEAKNLYRKALHSDGKACYELYLFAKEHSCDREIDLKYRDYLGFLKRAVDLKYPQAMYEYGKHILYSDRSNAIKLMEQAALQGVDDACMAISREYENGLYGYFPEGMPKMSEEECATNAAKWLTVAAERGNTQAQAKLGNLMRFHLKDEKGALEWFLKAAEQGDGEGQLGAARIYRKRKEYYKAQKYYKLAAEQGNTYAQLDLGEMLLMPEIFYDKEKAFYWFEKSANGGNTLAMRKLSEIYYEGAIVEADVKKCVYWLEMAAKKGDDNAAYDIGVRYLNGDGVEKDEKKAIKYLKFSAGKYHEGAMCELGFCYLNGVGVEKNLPKAEKMFKRALDEVECERAKEALETYFNNNQS